MVDTAERLRDALTRRILVFDGAMGTMIQEYRLGEADFRGRPYADHGRPLQGCSDILSVTRPDVIAAIHKDFLAAGADIVETNSFTATSISLADYDLAGQARAINLAAARVARDVVDAWNRTDAARPRFVAGSIGPTNKSASLSPDVNDPGARGIRFHELVASYQEQAEALLEGGVDLLIPETAFDTLNMKAALYAIARLFDQGARRVPVICSMTIPDRSGRTLSGQTLEAFQISVEHADLFAVSINCALGAGDMRPYVEEMARISPHYTACYPNAGLPNEFGQYDDTPEHMAEVLGEYARNGWLNLVGGCCGTVPAHIAAIAKAVEGVPPRRPASPPRHTRLSGYEALTITPESNFILIGERTNVTGSKKFRRLILEDRFDEALEVARDQVQGGANILDVCLDDGMLDGEAAMARLLDLIASEPDIARLPIMVDSSRFSILEVGLAHLQGKGVANSISLKEGEAEFLRQARIVRRFGAARGGDGVRRGGPGHLGRSAGRDLQARLPAPHRGGRLPGRGHHLRPQHPDGGDRHRGAQLLRGRLHRGGAPAQGGAAALQGLGRGVQHLLLLPRQRPGARGDARRLPLPRDPRRPRHGDRQRRPAGGLRGDRPGAEDRGRGRAARPQAGRHRAVDRAGRTLPGRREGGAGRTGLAQAARSPSVCPTPSGTASPTTSTRTSPRLSPSTRSRSTSSRAR